MKWWNLFRARPSRESELQRELGFHVEERVADLIKTGLSGDAARRRVRHEFGGMDQVQEDCRDVRPSRWLERLGADLTHSVRGMRKRPVLTLTIILTVAVCVAVNTAVFTVVDSLLIRSLPFPQADRLISMSNQYPKAGVFDQDASSAGDYADREGTIPAIAEQALYQFAAFPVDLGGEAVQLRGMMVTPSLFRLLRVQPSQGRFFVDSEAEPGKDPVVILTDGLWREMFGGGEAVGKNLRIGGMSYRVIGVLPAGFRFISPDARFFVPLTLNQESKQERHANKYRHIARLADGATIAQARSQIHALNVRVLEQTPAIKQMVLDAGYYTQVEALQPWLMRRARESLHLLWIGALLVLVVGAANVAGLSLARAHAQLPELVTRVALGATRADNICRALIDGLVPALTGGLFGIAGGMFALQLVNDELLPGAADISISPNVIGYALAGAIFAGIFAGIVSLAPLRNLDLGRSIQSGTRSTLRGLRLRKAFVVAQAALAFVLLNGAGTLTASIHELLRVDPGFRVANVWTASTNFTGSINVQTTGGRASVERILTGIRSLPGTELAGGGSDVPFSSGYNDTVIAPEGYSIKPGESMIAPIQLRVTPGYLETLGLTAVRGRLFDARDTSESPRVVILDERLARRFFGDAEPVGRRLYYPPGPRPGGWLTVIGVVRSIRLEDLSGAGNPNGVYYVPWHQNPSRQLSIVWRGNDGTAPAIRREFARLAPGAALFELRSMAERQELTLSARRTARALVLVFATVAVLLTALGINGLLAFLVSQQRREIGIRLAIGCRPVQVFNLFLSHGAKLIAVGVLGGLGLAIAIQPAVANQVYGVAAIEPWVIAASGALIGLVAVTAIALPAFRASRVDPIRALRDN